MSLNLHVIIPGLRLLAELSASERIIKIDEFKFINTPDRWSLQVIINNYLEQNNHDNFNCNIK